MLQSKFKDNEETYKVKEFELTLRRNFQHVPTSTPGIGPKWFGGTIVHCLVLPAQAIPFPQSLFVLSSFALGNLFFLLLSFNLSPAFTISFSSFLQRGQYLEHSRNDQ